MFALTDALRATGELREAEPRGFTAERAVAPLAIEGAEDELLGGDRREAGVARAGAAVAMTGYRYGWQF